ncbi:MAG TPA: Clp protease N-terminal domain-containing protein [Candidatus Dormibacteraeota bacterium]|nr:Clp protease N-terminal domain-containing protein [Candidatus Dormibacteraeota bacterium]
MAKATTVRFTEEVYQRLDQASARTGMPVNSIVVAAVLEWMQRHTPEAGVQGAPLSFTLPAAPRWSTIRRAMRRAGREMSPGMYPFERFSEHAKKLLTLAQGEAERAGFSYIGTEHLLLAAFGSPEFHSAQILNALEVKEDDVRAAIESVVTRKEAVRLGGIIPTSRVKKVIELAFQLCGAMGHPHVGTDHILLALATEGEGIAAHVMADAGATRKRIEGEIAKISEPES